jgi:hypothetical protein
MRSKERRIMHRSRRTDMSTMITPLSRWLIIPLVALLVFLSVSVVSIAHDYKGMIELQFGVNGGSLTIKGRPEP